MIFFSILITYFVIFVYVILNSLVFALFISSPLECFLLASYVLYSLEMFMTPCSTPPGSLLSPASPPGPPAPAQPALDAARLHNRLYDRLVLLYMYGCNESLSLRKGYLAGKLVDMT